MQKHKILELPLPSTAIISGPTLNIDSSDLLLSMDFDDEDRTRSARLRFVRQRAFRMRSEVHCAAWHATDTFDTVCEIQNSDWVRQLYSITPSTTSQRAFLE
jgi:hypothetical protein